LHDEDDVAVEDDEEEEDEEEGYVAGRARLWRSNRGV
jgi:hypothetical protein